MAGLRVPRWGFFATSPCTAPQLSLLQQVPDLWAVGPAELWQEKLLESWSGFPFGKLVDINWFIARLIHLSEEYRCFQCFFTSDVLECLCRTDVKLATLCGIYFLMRR